jgi:hypothetical protein
LKNVDVSMSLSAAAVRYNNYRSSEIPIDCRNAVAWKILRANVSKIDDIHHMAAEDLKTDNGRTPRILEQESSQIILRMAPIGAHFHRRLIGRRQRPQTGGFNPCQSGGADSTA